MEWNGYGSTLWIHMWISWYGFGPWVGLVSPCRGSRMTDLHNSRQPDMTSPPHRFRTTIMACNSYPVYKVKSHMALPDPHMPPGRFHHAIFVETSDDGFGTLHHVTGDVTSANGMSYESYTSSNVHPQQWSSVLASLPTPPQQKASNPKNQGRVEPFKEKVGGYGYVFYTDGEERKPLWKCTEWVEWYAIPALHERGLIQSGGQ
ncbi:hypothetical protein FOXG_15696 [Fusarium oxysporum f. sp. lycopersici 4287]|uniref:Uncharacterized protein n=1 Tax=Fusarium oxysporum f. sp. lycopersici (strain 4287 / CBS 123668 / FGSC 9935 / NRRL 34936) TaxID=426428 RepID=A0A0J9W597_FUSO4|nr:hypothetical protein FOXG_15696 [Fusarium oxysporum f. sp. lycopersici 4287]KNB18043.1 hypothetical protein FOXG_15696 [Fusarium oxysporum f. sp. lycopersici 4287]